MLCYTTDDTCNTQWQGRGVLLRRLFCVAGPLTLATHVLARTRRTGEGVLCCRNFDIGNTYDENEASGESVLCCTAVDTGNTRTDVGEACWGGCVVLHGRGHLQLTYWQGQGVLGRVYCVVQQMTPAVIMVG